MFVYLEPINASELFRPKIPLKYFYRKTFINPLLYILVLLCEHVGVNYAKETKR